jgi:hypothetical protein
MYLPFRLLLKFCLTVFILRTGWAQDQERSLLVGVDLSKNLPALPRGKNYEYFFQRSFIAEVPVYIPLSGSGFFLKVTPGYSSITADPIYRNLTYHNEGFSLRLGADVFANRYFSGGGGLNLALYDESGRYTFAGPFYEDLTFPFPHRRIFAVGLETHYAGYLYLGPNFFISPEVRFVIHSVSTKGSPDSYYIPGMGATDRDLPITGGVSIRVGYVFPSRN